MSKNPLNFRWIIIISLVMFASLPIVVLQLMQIVTLPQQSENELIERYKNEVSLTTELLKESVLSDAEKLSMLAENNIINQFISLWRNNQSNINESMYTELMNELYDFFMTPQAIPASQISETESRILEVGIDVIEAMNPSSLIFTNDNLTRVASMVYNQSTDQIINNTVSQPIEIPEAYYPFYSIKTFYPNKIQRTSTIIRWLNFTKTTLTTPYYILEVNHRSIPVNVHSRIVTNETGNFIGLVYVIISAEPLIKLMETIDDPDLPAILLDRSGYILYHSNESLVFTKISGYYETILNVGVDKITVDLHGFQGEISVFQQSILDIDDPQSLLVVKIIPRRIIFRVFEQNLIQSFFIIALFVVLATILAMITTRSVTTRLIQLTEAADQLSRGNLDVTLNVKGSDEIANLAKAFDRMTKSLKYVLKEDER